MHSGSQDKYLKEGEVKKALELLRSQLIQLSGGVDSSRFTKYWTNYATENTVRNVKLASHPFIKCANDMNIVDWETITPIIFNELTTQENQDSQIFALKLLFLVPPEQQTGSIKTYGRDIFRIFTKKDFHFEKMLILGEYLLKALALACASQNADSEEEDSEETIIELFAKIFKFFRESIIEGIQNKTEFFEQNKRQVVYNLIGFFGYIFDLHSQNILNVASIQLLNVPQVEPRAVLNKILRILAQEVLGIWEDFLAFSLNYDLRLRPSIYHFMASLLTFPFKTDIFGASRMLLPCFGDSRQSRTFVIGSGTGKLQLREALLSFFKDQLKPALMSTLEPELFQLVICDMITCFQLLLKTPQLHSLSIDSEYFSILSQLKIMIEKQGFKKEQTPILIKMASLLSCLKHKQVKTVSAVLLYKFTCLHVTKRAERSILFFLLFSNIGDCSYSLFKEGWFISRLTSENDSILESRSEEIIALSYTLLRNALISNCPVNSDSVDVLYRLISWDCKGELSSEHIYTFQFFLVFVERVFADQALKPQSICIVTLVDIIKNNRRTNPKMRWVILEFLSRNALESEAYKSLNFELIIEEIKSKLLFLLNEAIESMQEDLSKSAAVFLSSTEEEILRMLKILHHLAKLIEKLRAVEGVSMDNPLFKVLSFLKNSSLEALTDFHQSIETTSHVASPLVQSAVIQPLFYYMDRLFFAIRNGEDFEAIDEMNFKFESDFVAQESSFLYEIPQRLNFYVLLNHKINQEIDESNEMGSSKGVLGFPESISMSETSQISHLRSLIPTSLRPKIAQPRFLKVSPQNGENSAIQISTGVFIDYESSMLTLEVQLFNCTELIITSLELSVYASPSLRMNSMAKSTHKLDVVNPLQYKQENFSFAIADDGNVAFSIELKANRSLEDLLVKKNVPYVQYHELNEHLLFKIRPSPVVFFNFLIPDYSFVHSPLIFANGWFLARFRIKFNCQMTRDPKKTCKAIIHCPFVAATISWKSEPNGQVYSKGLYCIETNNMRHSPDAEIKSLLQKNKGIVGLLIKMAMFAWDGKQILVKISIEEQGKGTVEFRCQREKHLRTIEESYKEFLAEATKGGLDLF